MKSVVNVLISYLLIFSCVFSQDVKIVKASGECLISGDMTLSQARSKALDMARAEAIKQAVGVLVQSEIFRIESEEKKGVNQRYHEIFSALNTSVSYGRIIEEKILVDTLVSENVGDKNYFVWKVEISAKVVMESNFDPSFWIELNLNKDIYRDGEEIILEIGASKDCYVMILNILHNDSVLVILPNKYIGDLYLKAGQRYRFPPKGSVYSLIASLNGASRLTESLMVIGTREKYEFTGLKLTEYGDFGVIPSYKIAVFELMKWLSKIPPSMRATAFKTYEIRK